VHRTSLLVLTVVLVLAGCGRAPPGRAPAAPTPAGALASAPAADARAAAIRAAAPGLASLAGRRDAPGLDASWRAYFAGEELRLIEESVADPPRPPLENRYYFEHGALFFFTGEQPAEAGGGAGGAAPRAALLAEFRGAEAARAVRIEHYGAVRLAPERVVAIARRAAELASAARDERSATRVAP